VAALRVPSVHSGLGCQGEKSTVLDLQLQLHHCMHWLLRGLGCQGEKSTVLDLQLQLHHCMHWLLRGLGCQGEKSTVLDLQLQLHHCMDPITLPPLNQRWGRMPSTTPLRWLLRPSLGCAVAVHIFKPCLQCWATQKRTGNG
jgi:hypothetical protein